MLANGSPQQQVKSLLHFIMGHVARASFPAVRARASQPSQLHQKRSTHRNRRRRRWTPAGLTALLLCGHIRPSHDSTTSNSAPLIHTGPLFSSSSSSSSFSIYYAFINNIYFPRIYYAIYPECARVHSYFARVYKEMTNAGRCFFLLLLSLSI